MEITQNKCLKSEMIDESEEIKKLNTEAELTELLKSDGALIVLEFWASWCIACEKFLPALKEIAASHQNVIFVQVDVDKLADIACRYEVVMLPTLVFIKNDTVVEFLEHPNREKILNIIQKNSPT